MGCCPTCGQEVAAPKLLIDASNRRLSYNGMEVRLWRQEVDLLSAMLRAYPGTLDKDRGIHAIWDGDEPESSNLDDLLRHYVCKLRKSLRPLGLEVRTIRGFGWQLCAPHNLASAKAQVSRRRAS